MSTAGADEAQPSNRLRVGTWNVYCMNLAATADLAKAIAPCNLDVLCLNEMVPEATPALCEATGMPHFAALAAPWEAQLAIISRYPVVGAGGCMLSSDRGCLLVDLQLPGGHPVRVVTCHLNHRKEPQRMREWHRLQAFLQGKDPGCSPLDRASEFFGAYERKEAALRIEVSSTAAGEPPRRLQKQEMIRPTAEAESQPYILCGDFNALTRSDYDLVTWTKIATERQRSSWEPPQVELMDAVRAAGYTDVAQTAAASEHPAVGTCRDYIFLGPKADERWRPVPESYRVARGSLTREVPSDHRFCFVDLVPR